MAYIGKMAALPDDKIDVGLAALHLEKEFNPDLDVDAYSRELDVHARQARAWVNGSTETAMLTGVMEVILFINEKYGYDHSGMAQDREEPFLLSHLMDTRRGYCWTTHLGYIAIAQRAGLPIFPVSAPDHAFVRCVNPASGETRNIETTNGGWSIPDERYIKDFSITKGAIEKGTFLRTMSYREYLGVLLQASAQTYAQMGKFEKAIPRLEKAIELNPYYAKSYANLAYCYRMMSLLCKGNESFEYFDKGVRYYKTADELTAGTSL